MKEWRVFRVAVVVLLLAIVAMLYLIYQNTIPAKQAQPSHQTPVKTQSV